MKLEQSGDVRLIAEERWELPTAGGHDLSPTRDENRLYFTTNRHVYQFDKAKGEFSLDPALGDHARVKSVAAHPATGEVAAGHRSIALQSDLESERPSGCAARTGEDGACPRSDRPLIYISGGTLLYFPIRVGDDQRGSGHVEIATTGSIFAVNDRSLTIGEIGSLVGLEANGAIQVTATTSSGSPTAPTR